MWFRQDLRLTDNSALSRALSLGRPIIPVYVLTPEEEGDGAPGGAARWWLHQALTDLHAALQEVGLRLILRRGPSLDTLLQLARETGASTVCWNRRYEPAVMQRDGHLKQALREQGLTVFSENSALLHEPHSVANQHGKPFQVFTRFYKHCLTLGTTEPVRVDWQGRLIPKGWPASDPLDSWRLLPRIGWDRGFYRFWKPNRAGLKDRLDYFFDQAVQEYKEERNRPALDATSRLSPYLHWGQIGPRELVHALRQRTAMQGEGPRHFLSELYWREFAHHVLYHFPQTPSLPLRAEFNRFPWRRDEELIRAWQRGQTGYPIVDAGMRQLWETGWMHNRVRMVAGSFLVKHLLQPWQLGARWFWDTLVDADLANNTLGWQWTAGCGADAAPYFRIFNPILQGEKFDSDGTYVKRYVPELAKMPLLFLHRPWEAPDEVLERAGLSLGNNYPRPLIEHETGRRRAMTALQNVRDTEVSPPEL